MLKLVVGLGNPGSKYDGTRHNIGFEAVDRLAAGGPGARFARKFDGLLAEAEIDFRRVLLLKPETFMNLSGRSVAQALRFYKLEPGRPPGPLRRPEPPARQAPAPRGGLRRRPERAPRHHRPPRDRGLRPAPDRHRRPRPDRRLRLRPQPVPTRRTPRDRRRPDRRHPGRRRLGRPGARRRDEPVQRAQMPKRLRHTTVTIDRSTSALDRIDADTDRPTEETRLASQHLRRDVPAGQRQGRRRPGTTRSATSTTS